MEERENANENATAIQASVVYLKDCIVNVQAGGINNIISSIYSHRVSICFGILAVICGLVLAHWTFVQLSNSGPSSEAYENAAKNNDYPKQDETINDAGRNNQQEQDSTHASKKGAGSKGKPHEEIKPSWEAVARVLTAVTPLVPETVNYGEHTFVCEAKAPYFKKFELRWKGKCTDEKTGLIALCKGCLSPTTSVERAAAQLIRDMVSRGIYPQPSETQRMPLECDC